MAEPPVSPEVIASVSEQLSNIQRLVVRTPHDLPADAYHKLKAFLAQWGERFLGGSTPLGQAFTDGFDDAHEGVDEEADHSNGSPGMKPKVDDSGAPITFGHPSVATDAPASPPYYPLSMYQNGAEHSGRSSPVRSPSYFRPGPAAKQPVQDGTSRTPHKGKGPPKTAPESPEFDFDIGPGLTPEQEAQLEAFNAGMEKRHREREAEAKATEANATGRNARRKARGVGEEVQGSNQTAEATSTSMRSPREPLPDDHCVLLLCSQEYPHLCLGRKPQPEHLHVPEALLVRNSTTIALLISSKPTLNSDRDDTLMWDRKHSLKNKPSITTDNKIIYINEHIFSGFGHTAEKQNKARDAIRDVSEGDAWNAVQIWVRWLLSGDKEKGIERKFETPLKHKATDHLLALADFLGCRGDFMKAVEKEIDKVLKRQQKFGRMP